VIVAVAVDRAYPLQWDGDDRVARVSSSKTVFPKM
jgi:hypothetical protein